MTIKYIDLLFKHYKKKKKKKKYDQHLNQYFKF